MTSPSSDKGRALIDKVRRKQILDAFDAVLNEPEETRQDWLRARYADDERLIAAVETLLAADALAPSIMPTELNDGDGHTTLVPPARVGAYVLTQRLGGGGMGEVWLGKRDDGLFEHEVAIKLMRPSRIAEAALTFFNTERRALARMRHKHIARLFDGGVTPEGIPWIIMERIEGGTLAEWMEARNPSQAEAIRVMIAVAEAVQYAHQQLVVHADLKPSNILVDGDGEPYLVDFGISSLAAPDRSSTATATGFPRTTVYASPERLAGRPPAPADDIYALGLLLRGLLTHQWPEDGATAPLNSDLSAIVSLALAPTPETRYPTAQAFADDLKAFSARRPVSARPAGVLYQAGLFLRRHPLSSGSALAGLLAMIVALSVISLLYARAETRFNEVRTLAGYMLGDYYDALEQLPGTSALRARTASIGSEYLARLSQVPGASADLRRDLAVGYGRIGHAMATTSTNATGDTAEGEKALSASEKGFRDLLRQYPDRDDIRRELARTLTWKSGLLLGAHNDFKGAYAAVDEALGLFDAVLKRNPNDLDAAYGRWNAENGRNDILYADSRYADVAKQSAQALAQGRGLPATGAYATLKPLLIAGSENTWGDAIYDQANSEPAIVHYKQALATLEAARAAGLPDIRIRIRLGAYYYQVGSSYQDTGRPREALVWIDKGVQLMDEVSRYDDSTTTQRLTSLLNLTRAGVLSDLGRLPEARLAALEPVAAKRQLARLHPGEVEAQASLASALRVYAQYLDKWHQPKDACAAMGEAKGIWLGVAAHGGISQRLQTAEVDLVDARLKTCP